MFANKNAGLAAASPRFRADLSSMSTSLPPSPRSGLRAPSLSHLLLTSSRRPRSASGFGLCFLSSPLLRPELVRPKPLRICKSLAYQGCCSIALSHERVLNGSPWTSLGTPFFPKGPMALTSYFVGLRTPNSHNGTNQLHEVDEILLAAAAHAASNR